MKTKAIFIVLVLSASFASAAQKIKSAQLICTNGIKESMFNNVVANQQIVGGQMTNMIDTLSLRAFAETPINSVILGQFDNKSDFESFSSQEMSSTGFEKTSGTSKYKVEETIKFGFQKIGQSIVGYAKYTTSAFEGEFVSLLKCRQVIK